MVQFLLVFEGAQSEGIENGLERMLAHWSAFELYLETAINFTATQCNAETNHIYNEYDGSKLIYDSPPAPQHHPLQHSTDWQSSPDQCCSVWLLAYLLGYSATRLLGCSAGWW